jgi:hypothetical protein
VIDCFSTQSLWGQTCGASGKLDFSRDSCLTCDLTMSIHPWIHPSVRPSVRPSVHPSVRPSIYYTSIDMWSCSDYVGSHHSGRSFKAILACTAGASPPRVEAALLLGLEHGGSPVTRRSAEDLFAFEGSALRSPSAHPRLPASP